MVIGKAILVLIGTTIPALVWLFFFLREEEHSEPKRLIAKTFLWGGGMALVALALELAFRDFVYAIPDLQEIAIPVLAVIEEGCKFLAAFFAIRNETKHHEPTDFMIYMVTAALGFATLENIFIIGNNLNPNDSLFFATTASTLLLRLVGATLLHALSSGTLGYYWGESIRSKTNRAMPFFYGFLLATFLHSVFNFLVLRYQDNLLLYPSTFLIVGLFFLLNDFEKARKEEEAENTMV